jgi:hypothetical protein
MVVSKYCIFRIAIYGTPHGLVVDWGAGQNSYAVAKEGCLYVYLCNLSKIYGDTYICECYVYKYAYGNSFTFYKHRLKHVT